MFRNWQMNLQKHCSVHIVYCDSLLAQWSSMTSSDIFVDYSLVNLMSINTLKCVSVVTVHN